MENDKIAGLEIERLREIALERFGKDDYEHLQKVAIMVASAHCAKVSYNNHGAGIDYKKDIALYDRLLGSGHNSVFEHCARAMTEDQYLDHLAGFVSYKEIGDNQLDELFDENNNSIHGWSGNFRGFIQLRKTMKNENRS